MQIIASNPYSLMGLQKGLFLAFTEIPPGIGFCCVIMSDSFWNFSGIATVIVWVLLIIIE